MVKIEMKLIKIDNQKALFGGGGEAENLIRKYVLGISD